MESFTDDELVLCLDAFRTNEGTGVSEGTPWIRDLSDFLRENPFHPGGARDASYRSSVGISRRIRNFVALDRDDGDGDSYSFVPRSARSIWETYSGDLEKLRKDAARIRAGRPSSPHPARPVAASNLTEPLSRYDLFQLDAVQSVVEDFSAQGTGRFLLVVPTGGGKTFVAVRAIERMFQQGLLDLTAHRVLWVAHRIELLDQARGTAERQAEGSPIPAFKDQIDFCMLGKVKEQLAGNENVRLAVIDEAHHGAANSYRPLFDRSDIGILGLTATPSRHDGKSLDFEKESYSIGFPDLVDLGVLLRPEVVTVDGGTYTIDSIGEPDQLSVLNNAERNRRILNELAADHDRYRKVIVYVGTVEHARALYDEVRQSSLGRHYDFVGFITGEARARFLASEAREVHEDRADFIAAQRIAARSIVINVDVLTEGFDDPSVNTVVMARPTKSKLLYMQAIGRAVRVDPSDEDKAAYIVEVSDDLPNIRYRIDNRWLFSDISDVLEPRVVDREYPDVAGLEAAIESVFDEYSVDAAFRGLPPIPDRSRVTLLLFKVYSGPGSYYHLPLLITNETRRRVADFFDFLSARVDRYRGASPEALFRMVADKIEGLSLFHDQLHRNLVFHAMENSWVLAATSIDETEKSVYARGDPWITFVAFKLRRDAASLDPDFVDFTEDMLNREAIRELLLTESYADGYFLVKLPMPLSGTWGRLMPPHEFAILYEIVEQLAEIEVSEAVDQWTTVRDILDGSVFPIEQKHREALTAVVREQMDYFRELRKS